MSALLVFCLRLIGAILIIALVRAATDNTWSSRSYARALQSRRGRTRKARPFVRTPRKVQP